MNPFDNNDYRLIASVLIDQNRKIWYIPLELNAIEGFPIVERSHKHMESIDNLYIFYLLSLNVPIDYP